MKLRKLLFLVLLIQAPIAWSQCAPGIPGAGNPGCIPPTQPGSPYNQGGDAPVAPVAPAIKWVGGWGAVAMDEDYKGGTVEDRDSKDEAETIALDLCKRNGGNKCKVLVTFDNQCAAMVQEPDGGTVHGNTGATTELAEQRALGACRGGNRCEVIYSKCSHPHPAR